MLKWWLANKPVRRRNPYAAATNNFGRLLNLHTACSLAEFTYQL
jgi:hypothetical protein